jgi:hypothetical protein
MENNLEELLLACAPIVRALSASNVAEIDTEISQEDGENFIAVYRKMQKKNNNLGLREAVLLHNLAACLDICLPLIEHLAEKEENNAKGSIKLMTWQIRRDEFVKEIARARKVLTDNGSKLYF